MFKRLQKRIDVISSGTTTVKCRVEVYVDIARCLPSTVKQVRVVWAKRAGGGVKASTDNCVTHLGTNVIDVSVETDFITDASVATLLWLTSDTVRVWLLCFG